MMLQNLSYYLNAITHVIFHISVLKKVDSNFKIIANEKIMFDTFEKYKNAE